MCDFCFSPIQQAEQQILSQNNIECVRSCDQQPYLFIETKESICIKKEFDSHRVTLLLQYGGLLIIIVSLLQHGGHDVTRTQSIFNNLMTICDSSGGFL